MAVGNSKGMSNICKLKYHYVYQTKNLINGKTYIGRHSTNNLNDGYIGSGKMLKRAIQKYGKENFVCIPMCYFDTYEESVDEEKFLVTREYCKDKNNYNIVEGGSNPIMYGDANAMKGNTHSKKTLDKIRNSSKKFFTPIIIDNIEYDSMSKAASIYKIGVSKLINYCLNKNISNINFKNISDNRKYSNKLAEKQLKSLEYYRNKYVPKEPNIVLKVDKIKNLNLRTEYLKTIQKKIVVNDIIYESIKSVSLEYNIHPATVDTRCVSPHFKNWRYENEEHQKIREEIYYNKVNKRYSKKRSITAELKKPVIIIENKNYYSFKEAGRDYGIFWETVQKRGVSDDFKEWIFPNKEDYKKYKNKFEKILEKDRNRRSKRK